MHTWLFSSGQGHRWSRKLRAGGFEAPRLGRNITLCVEENCWDYYYINGKGCCWGVGVPYILYYYSSNKVDSLLLSLWLLFTGYTRLFNNSTIYYTGTKPKSRWWGWELMAAMEEEREDVVEGWVFPTSIIITICFPAPWRKCNAYWSWGWWWWCGCCWCWWWWWRGDLLLLLWLLFTTSLSKDRGKGKRGGPVQLQSQSRWSWRGKGQQSESCANEVEDGESDMKIVLIIHIIIRQP